MSDGRTGSAASAITLARGARPCARDEDGGVTDAAAGPLVIIVEDDEAIATGLALNLRLQDYRTEVARDGESAAMRIDTGADPDLVLLDITLPKRNGLEVLAELRAADNHVPVIVLSARQDEFDKVAALRLGADDYVTKPFALAELLARIAAVLRRASLRRGRGRSRRGRGAARRARASQATAGPRRATLRCAVHVRRRGRRRRRAHGHAGGASDVKLTHLEFELLSFFCRNAGRVFSRDQLVHAVWGRQAGQPRTVDNFVAQLRAKLEPDPDRPATSSPCAAAATASSRRSSREESAAVRGDDVAVPGGGVLERALLGRVVDVDQAEAVLVALGPLEVVEDRPVEVGLDGDAGGDRGGQLAQVAGGEVDAGRIVDRAVGRDPVALPRVRSRR